jgi:hypothetical protein
VDNMRPVFAKGNERSVQLLLQLRKEAIKDQEPRPDMIPMRRSGFAFPTLGMDKEQTKT